MGTREQAKGAGYSIIKERDEQKKDTLPTLYMEVLLYIPVRCIFVKEQRRLQFAMTKEYHKR